MKMVISCLSQVVVVFCFVLFFCFLFLWFLCVFGFVFFLHTCKLQINHGVSMELSQKYNKKTCQCPFYKILKFNKFTSYNFFSLFQIIHDTIKLVNVHI